MAMYKLQRPYKLNVSFTCTYTGLIIQHPVQLYSILQCCHTRNLS